MPDRTARAFVGVLAIYLSIALGGCAPADQALLPGDQRLADLAGIALGGCAPADQAAGKPRLALRDVRERLRIGMKVADVVEALGGFEGEGTFLPLSIPCLMYLSAEGGWYQLIFTSTSGTYELEVVLHHPEDCEEGDPDHLVLPTREELEKKGASPTSRPSRPAADLPP